MKEISAVQVNAPVAIGDIVIENCAGTGVAVIATKNVPCSK
jgi:CxxC motif-containing protein